MPISFRHTHHHDCKGHQSSFGKDSSSFRCCHDCCQFIGRRFMASDHVLKGYHHEEESPNHVHFRGSEQSLHSPKVHISTSSYSHDAFSAWDTHCVCSLLSPQCCGLSLLIQVDFHGNQVCAQMGNSGGVLRAELQDISYLEAHLEICHKFKEVRCFRFSQKL